MSKYHVARALQSASAHPQQAQSHGNALDQLGELLTTEMAAERLLFVADAGGDVLRGVRNFWKWANRYHVPKLRRGSRVLWQASTLAAFLKGDKWTRRHGAESSPLRVVPATSRGERS